MSRNFELLQQIAQDQLEFETAQARSVDDPPATNLSTRGARASYDKSIDTEAIRLLHQLMWYAGKNSPRAVVFSNIDREEQCDWIWRAGEVLAAQKQGSVCLVDANLAHPSAHSYFEIDNRRGLFQALAEPGALPECAYRMADSQLTVVPSGASAMSECSEVLSSAALHRCINQLRSEFDFVLISAPPILKYSGTILMCQWAGGIVLVAKADFTDIEATLKAKRELQSANVKLLGAVMIKPKSPIPQWLSSILKLNG